jgi:hypothetical protein
MFNGAFRLTIIVRFVSEVWPFSSWSRPHRSLSGPFETVYAQQLVLSTCASTAETPPTVRIFWNWSGSYVGYRASDGLFHMDGHQVGYFAEGDEIYGCQGGYLGEVRGPGRLITNLSKKAWARKTQVPCALKRSVAHRNIEPMEMLPGYEDFPVASM